MVKKDNSRMLIITAVVVIIIIIIAAVTINKEEKVDYSKMSDEEVKIAVENKVEKMTVSNVAGMGERDRMEYYVSTFISTVEAKDYEKAYDMLYDDFKKNFFPTLDSFKEYADSKFPKMFSLDHTNFERNGDVYVLWVELSNPLGSKDSAMEMNFVVQEYNLNDFALSFTVK